LELETGTAIPKIRRTYQDISGRPIAVIVGHFHPERVEMTVKLQLASMDKRRVDSLIEGQ